MKYLPVTALIISAILLYSNIRETNCIINGRSPRTGEAKYAVGIEDTICSGAILDDTHILTSAQCFNSNKLNSTQKLRIVTESGPLRSKATTFVKRAYVLASFVKDGANDDIGVLELSTSLAIEQNKDKFAKVALPSARSKYVGANYLAVGYGYSNLSEVYNVPPRFLVADATILNSHVCGRILGGGYMLHRMCVAIVEDPTRTTIQGYCSGDEGSPIVIEGAVVGIVTDVRSCQNNEQPAVATDVTYYLSFVQKAVSNNVTPDMLVYNFPN